MKIISILSFILSCCFCQAQDWTSINIGTPVDLNKVYFIDDDVGFVAGDEGVLFKTTNGGEDWISVPTNVTHDLFTISFVDQNIGFVNGLKTVDGGNSWSIQSETKDLGLIKALDEQNLIGGDAVYFHGEVYKSLDGGATWITTVDPISTGFYTDEYFINDSIGYLTSWNSGNLVKTVDGGESWIKVTSVDLLAQSSSMYGVTFPTADIGILASNNHIMKTTDGDQTWVSIYPISANSSSFKVRGIYAVTADNYIVVGGGFADEIETIYETKDGGSTWVLSNNSFNRLEDVTCTNDDCYAVGENGTVLTKSTFVANTDQESQALTEITLYPNPTNDYFQLKGIVDKANLTIFDVDGKMIKTVKKASDLEKISISTFPEGLYFIEVRNDKNHLISIGEFVKK